MTATTPKLGLRYPTGGDAPCDGGQQLIDLRDDIWGHLNDYNDIIERQRDLPMVSVAYSGAQLVPPGNPGVRFNSVEQDDIRGADLIADANQITLGQPGFEGAYLTGFMIAIQVVESVFPQMIGDMVNTYPPYDTDIGSYGVLTVPPILSGSTLALIGGPTTMRLNHTGVDPEIVTFARLWAVRIGGL